MTEKTRGFPCFKLDHLRKIFGNLRDFFEERVFYGNRIGNRRVTGGLDIGLVGKHVFLIIWVNPRNFAVFD